MLKKTYLIVKKRQPDIKFPPKTVDMTIIIDDLPQDDLSSRDKLVRATAIEYNRLLQQYPANEYFTHQVHTDTFPEPEYLLQYLKEHRLSEVRELEASRILSERNEETKK